jgi:hypothetical protein
MSCPDCQAATQRSHWEFRADCKGCIARGVARAPHFRRCRDQQALDRAYRQHLEQAGVTHEQVKAAALADFETRAQAERQKLRRAA